MARPDESGESGAAGGAVADAVGLAEPLRPVRAGGSGRPIGLAITTAAILATLVWQPWGKAGGTAVPPADSGSAVANVGESTASGPPGTATSPGASPGPGSSRMPDRGPRPSFGPNPSGVPGSATYVSLVDNEWTVVALVASDALASYDEPAVLGGTGTLQAPGGSLLVRQTWVAPALSPLERSGRPDVACQAPVGVRDHPAAHFPAGQVVYLGVTFPGMSPRARVSAQILGRAGTSLKYVPLVVVRLSGMIDGRSYVVPASGTGGAALFTMADGGVLSTATYRFSIRAPNFAGVRHLYACIGS